jgi:uncharacterized delta-60 repeat protein
MIRRSQHVTAFECLESRTLFNAGDLDPTFGDHGIAANMFPGEHFNIYDVAIQQDGKIVVAGLTTETHVGVVVARMNADGSVDQSFGVGGRWDFAQDQIAYTPSLAIQGDGKIVIASTWFPSFDESEIAIGRLTATGQPDLSFGAGGYVHTNIGDAEQAHDVAIQQDGKIVVAGYSRIGGDFDFTVVRYHTSGVVDFKHTFGFGGDDAAYSVAIDYTGTPVTNPLYGSIVVAGHAGSDMGVLRLTPEGELDDSFDNDGKLSTDFPGDSEEGIKDILIKPGSKIVAVGYTMRDEDWNYDLAMARYLPDGQLDPTFGTGNNGKIVIGTPADDRPAGMAASYLGGFVVGGQLDGKSVVMAFTPDGAFDTRFSVDGIVETDVNIVLGIASTGNGIAPVRRVAVAGIDGIARYVDVGSVIGIGSFDPDAAETAPNTATISVGRTRPLNKTERVYINFGGTARAPWLLNADYTVSGMTVQHPLQGPSYIDIPAGQTIASATITPVNDSAVEGDETIVIGISGNATYDIGNPASTTLVIRDNDIAAGPTVTSWVFDYDSGPPQRVRFVVNQDVTSSIGAGDFTVTGPSGAVPFNFSHDSVTNTTTLSFNNILPDGNYVARAIASGITNSQGTAMPADSELNFFFLGADADHDRDVDVNDLAALASNWQQTGRTFSQGDFSYDGKVDVVDLAILANKWQSSVGIPSAPFAAPTHSVRAVELMDLLL